VGHRLDEWTRLSGLRVNHWLIGNDRGNSLQEEADVFWLYVLCDL